jgi:class 3 adenylate cyclase
MPLSRDYMMSAYRLVPPRVGQLLAVGLHLGCTTRWTPTVPIVTRGCPTGDECNDLIRPAGSVGIELCFGCAVREILRIVPTQVFLLTDIEGSTRRWAEHPSEMRDALERHDDVLRTVLESAGGVVFKHSGDGLFVVFDSAGAAIAAAVGAQEALALQDWTTVGPLKVRMAIHAGEAERRGDDWFGPALNRTARLASLAHGGQVVVSDAVRALLVDVPLGAIALVDLGVHGLRDLSAPERVWQAVAPGLQREFPPLTARDRTVRSRTEDTPSNTQGAPRLVGRHLERAALEGAVRAGLEGSPSMVLIVGEPGIGKSTLTAHVAALARGGGAGVVYGSAEDLDRSALGRWREPWARLAGSGRLMDPDLGPDDQRWDVLARLSEILQRAAPVVVVLEDLHWSDSLSSWVFGPRRARSSRRCGRAGPDEPS